MEKEIKRIKNLPSSWMEMKIGDFFQWIVTTPKTKLGRQNKFMTMFFATIWILAAIIWVLAGIGFFKSLYWGW